MDASVTRIATPTAPSRRLGATPGVPKVPKTTQVATTAATSRTSSRARRPLLRPWIDAAGGDAGALDVPSGATIPPRASTRSSGDKSGSGASVACSADAASGSVLRSDDTTRAPPEPRTRSESLLASVRARASDPRPGTARRLVNVYPPEVRARPWPGHDSTKKTDRLRAHWEGSVWIVIRVGTKTLVV